MFPVSSSQNPFTNGEPSPSNQDQSVDKTKTLVEQSRARALSAHTGQLYRDPISGRLTYPFPALLGGNGNNFPILNLGSLESEILSTDPQVQKKARSDFKEIMKNVGFFYLSDHGIDASLFNDFIEVTEEFFKQPEETLMTMQKPISGGFARGFTPVEGESTAKAINAGNYGDLCMKYTMGMEDNFFPDERFENTWRTYYEKISNTARRVLKLIGATLNLDRHESWERLLDGNPLLRHLNYPDTPIERCSDKCEVPRMAPHHDIGLITLLYQTPCPNGFSSLQAKIGSEFRDIPAIDGVLVVNFGEVLSFLTNGEIKATTHRVVAPPASSREGSSRTTSICFFDPKPDFPVMSLKDSMIPGSEVKPFSKWVAETLERFSSLNQR